MRKAHATFWWVSAGALAVLFLALYLPPLRGVFRFGVLHPNDLALAFAGGAASLLWFELLKMFKSDRRAVEIS